MTTLEEVRAIASRRATEMRSAGAATRTPGDVPPGWLLWSQTWNEEDQGESRLDTLLEIYLTSSGDVIDVRRERLIERHGTMELPCLGSGSLLSAERLPGWWEWACAKPLLGISKETRPEDFLERLVRQVAPPLPRSQATPGEFSPVEGLSTGPRVDPWNILAVGTGIGTLLWLLVENPAGLEGWVKVIVYAGISLAAGWLFFVTAFVAILATLVIWDPIAGGAWWYIAYAAAGLAAVTLLVQAVD